MKKTRTDHAHYIKCWNAIRPLKRQGLSQQQIADRLTSKGFRTVTGSGISQSFVSWVTRTYGTGYTRQPTIIRAAAKPAEAARACEPTASAPVDDAPFLAPTFASDRASEPTTVEIFAAFGHIADIAVSNLNPSTKKKLLQQTVSAL